jgi:hypothetical protein
MGAPRRSKRLWRRCRWGTPPTQDRGKLLAGEVERMSSGMGPGSYSVAGVIVTETIATLTLSAGQVMRAWRIRRRER